MTDNDSAVMREANKMTCADKIDKPQGYKYVMKCESTPNPSSYKWIINYDFAADDMYEYESADTAASSGLATALWSLNELVHRIDRIFFHDNMVVIHKAHSVLWDDVFMAEISDVIDANMGMCVAAGVSDIERSDVDQMIIEVINDYIQPAINDHGGLIKFHRFEDGVVYVSLHGSCNGCESSDTTLYNGVENILKFYIPGIKELKTVD